MRRCTLLYLFPLPVLALPLAAQTGLSPLERRILRATEAEVPAALALIERTVNVNSGTLNMEGVRKVGELYRPLLDSLGFTVRWAEMPASMKRAGHLVAERKGGRGKRILIIGHLDTVFEPSSDFQTFRRDATRVYGPGVSDMKGGNAIALLALRALQQAGALDGAQITVVLTGDEELPGVPLAEARKALIDAARRSDIALEFEDLITDAEGDWVTIARRSSTGWKLEVTGRGAHSSGIFRDETGAGAIYETARILNGFYEEIRGEPGATFSPGVLVAGTDVRFDADEHRGTAAGKANIVARTAIVSGDIRTITEESLQRVRSRMRAIVAKSLPGTSATITFREGYPAMAPTDANRRLAETLNRINRDAGFPTMRLLDPVRRGAADISFVADYVDGLAGLGAEGRAGHTERESMELESLPRQIGRAALLIHRLTQNKEVSQAEPARPALNALPPR
ncbi:MAG: M20/M25/M40 family metallo-hydrolase [Gemmatimonadales bacterium]